MRTRLPPASALAPVLVAALVLAGTAACSSTKSKIGGPVRSSEPATTDTTQPLDSVASTATKVYIGSEPRRQVRFHPTLGATFSTKVELAETFTLQAGDYQYAPSGTVPFAVTVNAKISAIDPDDTIRGTFTLNGATADTTGLPAAQARAAQAALSSIEGRAGQMSMRTTGAITDIHVDEAGLSDTAKSLVDQTTGAIHEMVVPFPTEPVGEEATWEVGTTVPYNGLVTTVVLDVTLDRLTTDDIDLTLVYHQTAPLGPLPLSGAPAGVSAELLSFKVDGPGAVKSDLTHLLPPSCKIQASGDILSRVLLGAQEGRIDQKVTFKLSATDATS